MVRNRDELKSVRKWQSIVLNIEEEERLIRASFGVKSPGTEEHGGPGLTRDQKLANAITRLDELEAEKINCLNMIRHVSNKIRKLKKPEEIRLLHLVYIAGMTYEKAAETMGYSLRAVYYVKDRALDHYDEL